MPESYLDYGFDQHLNRGTTVVDSAGNGIVDLITQQTPIGSLPSGEYNENLRLGRQGFILGGANAYNDGDGFFLGYRVTEEDYGFFIGNSTGNKLTYNTTDDVLSITGTISAGTFIGGEIHIPDEDTTTSSFHTNTSGTSWWGATETNFNADNNNAPAWINASGAARFSSVTITGASSAGGWNIIDGYIYNLSSGTPTVSPNNGIVLASGNEALIIYEGIAERVRVGYLSLGVYGWKVWDTLGTTVIGEISDAQQYLSGFTLGATDFTVGSTNIIIDASAKAISINSATFATDGIQLQYNAGNPRAYIGNGSTYFFNFDGTNISWGAVTSSLSTAGHLTTTSATIGGFTVGATTIASNATAANAGILIDSGNSLIRVGATSADYITIDGANKRIRSSDYVSGALGAGFTLEPDLLEVGNISARGRIQSVSFIANSISAVNGDIAIVVGSDTLNTDMTALDASTVTITGDTTLAVNDIIRIKEGVNDEWMLVTNVASAPTYTVTRDQASAYAANSNPAWTKGSTVVNFGQSGQGGLFLTANDTNAPFLSVFTHAGSPWSAMTTRVRVGNLNGYLGYVADIFGVGIGTSGAGEANITIEPTNGFRIRSGTTTLMQVTNAGTATIGSFTLASTTISATNLTLTSGAANVANITVGTGSNAGGLNAGNASGDILFWGGDTFANRATAPFRVTGAGALTVSSLSVTSIDAGSLLIGGVAVTSSAAELNILDGFTGSTANLNTLVGGTSSVADSLHIHLPNNFVGLQASSTFGLNGGSIAMTSNGRYLLSSDTTAWLVWDSWQSYNFNYRRTAEYTRSALTITPAVNTRVMSSSTEYVIAFAAGGTTGYRYDADGQNESAALTISGTSFTGVQRMGYNQTLGYVYIQDGADQSSTTIKRFTFSGTTLTYVDTVTLSAAPANAGSRFIWIGDTNMAFIDAFSNTVGTIKRYGRSSGTATTDRTWGHGTAGQNILGYCARQSDNAFFWIQELDSVIDNGCVFQRVYMD